MENQNPAGEIMTFEELKIKVDDGGNRLEHLRGFL